MQRDEMKNLLEQEFARFAGQIMRHVDNRIDGLRTEMTERIDRLTVTVDGLAKRIHEDDQERAVVVVEQQRHRVWIEQLAKHTNTRLLPE